VIALVVAVVVSVVLIAVFATYDRSAWRRRLQAAHVGAAAELGGTAFSHPADLA
jgi:hypothetical protein